MLFQSPQTRSRSSKKKASIGRRPSRANTLIDVDVSVPVVPPASDFEAYPDYLSSTTTTSHKREERDCDVEPHHQPRFRRTDSESTLVPPSRIYVGLGENVDEAKIPSALELLQKPEIRSLIMYNLEMAFISEILFCIYPLFAFTSTEAGAFLILSL
jgi:hypothetical protein